MIDSSARSILAVDCGSVNTTAILIEQVDNQYRLVATGRTASTYAPPWQNITLGVTEAIRQIEEATGRNLLAPGGWPMTPQSSSKRGVDAFFVVSSAGPPLRLALAGSMQNISLASARRAAATTYSAITNVLALDATPDAISKKSDQAVRQSSEGRIQAIREAQPDVILLVGGTDDGAKRSVIDMANTLATAMQVMKDVVKPHILYAGNSNMRPKIAEILGPVTSLNSVDNIRPTLAIENLAPTQMALESLYVQRKMSRLPGFQKLSNWTKHPIIPVSKSFERVVAYIGRHNRLNVLGVNIGSGSTFISTQAQDIQGSTVRSDAGVGHSMPALLKSVPPQKIERWLPFPIDPEELYNQLLNKGLHPTSVPTTKEGLLMEYAVAREGLRLVITQARNGWPTQPGTGRGDIQWNLLIGAGRTLTGTPHPGHAAMILLDGVEPWGVTSLALDISGTTSMLGSIAAIQPVAAVEVGARDTFLNLGTVIAPMGHGTPGKTALRVKLKVDGSSSTEVEPVEIEVPYGSIEVIELPSGQKATLEIRPSRHFDIGLGQPGRGAVTKVEGGVLGIIIDARGRPLRLPQDEGVRQDWLGQWMSKLDAGYATSGKNNQLL